MQAPRNGIAGPGLCAPGNARKSRVAVEPCRSPSTRRGSAELSAVGLDELAKAGHETPAEAQDVPPAAEEAKAENESTNAPKGDAAVNNPRVGHFRSKIGDGTHAQVDLTYC